MWLGLCPHPKTSWGASRLADNPVLRCQALHVASRGAGGHTSNVCVWHRDTCFFECHLRRGSLCERAGRKRSPLWGRASEFPARNLCTCHMPFLLLPSAGSQPSNAARKMTLSGWDGPTMRTVFKHDCISRGKEARCFVVRARKAIGSSNGTPSRAICGTGTASRRHRIGEAGRVLSTQHRAPWLLAAGAAPQACAQLVCLFQPLRLHLLHREGE